MNRYSASQAHRLLPLLNSVVREIGELREKRIEVATLIMDLERSSMISPEGFEESLNEAQARLAEIAEALRRCIHELFRLGVYMQNTAPFILHIPGVARGKKVVFRWQEGDRAIQTMCPTDSGPIRLGPWTPKP